MTTAINVSEIASAARNMVLDPAAARSWALAMEIHARDSRLAAAPLVEKSASTVLVVFGDVSTSLARSTRNRVSSTSAYTSASCGKSSSHLARALRAVRAEPFSGVARPAR